MAHKETTQRDTTMNLVKIGQTLMNKAASYDHWLDFKGFKL